MQITIKYSEEFINTISTAKSKKAQRNNILREILYKRADIRFYCDKTKCLGPDKQFRDNLAIRKLDEIKALKQQLKTI